MRVASVSSVAPTTTGTALDERTAIDRDRAQQQRQVEQERRQVQPAAAPGTGARLDRRA
jgi:hypothetical protein